jgi:RNA recognition motif-containing protein
MLSEIVIDQHRIKYLDPRFSALPDPLHFMPISPTISSLPRKLFLACAQVDEELLFELFLNAGPLQRVTIPRDRETKKAKAFAFIGRPS